MPGKAACKRQYNHSNKGLRDRLKAVRSKPAPSQRDAKLPEEKSSNEPPKMMYLKKEVKLLNTLQSFRCLRRNTLFQNIS